jgi:hypothetical protein
MERGDPGSGGLRRRRQGDAAVYWQAEGLWYVRKSSDGQMLDGVPINWGHPIAAPVPADYDGDGKTDLCVYVSTTGKWYIRKSSDGTLLGGGTTPQNGGIPWGHPVVTPANAQYQILRAMGLVR